MLRELGWTPGKKLDLDTLHGMILIAAAPTGQHTIDHRGAINLPATSSACAESKSAHHSSSQQPYPNR